MFDDLIGRSLAPTPWAEGETIPWHEPGFSARMLREHLAQAHDAASRRMSRIDAHVAWLHATVLGGRPGRVLDLGCGPGLYTERLAALGHTCVGIDLGPAAIAYARGRAAELGLSHACTYHQGDLRRLPWGEGGYDLIMLIFGEFNSFRPAHAARLLERAHAALREAGHMLLEAHTDTSVRRLGEAPRTWTSAETGLFSDRPHLRLDESFWDARRRAATRRYWIVDATTGAVTRHAQSWQAHTIPEVHDMLLTAGFAHVEINRGDWDGAVDANDFRLLLASRD